MQFDNTDIETMDKAFRAMFINSLSGFKSANLLGTRSASGDSNLSVVSSAVHLGAHPPLMGVVFRPDVSPRHSLDNIRETGVFTLNHINESIMARAHQTAARYPRDTSEFDACGLTIEQDKDFHAPAVKEAAISMGLELREEHPLTINGTHFVIAEIVWVRMQKDWIAADGYVDIEAAGTLAISGLDGYHRTQSIHRMAYPKPDKTPEPLHLKEKKAES